MKCVVVISLTVGLTIGAVTGVSAQDFEASADLGLFSAYVWRGQVLNDEMVLQPAVTISKRGFSINVWGNFDLTDNSGYSGDFTEVDLTLSYGGKVGPVSLEGGICEYLFPNPGGGTREVYLSAGLAEMTLAPTLLVSKDIDEIDGMYVNIGVSHGFEITDRVSIEVGLSGGWANSAYNDGYFEVGTSALNDGALTIGAGFGLTEKVEIGAAVQYTWLWESEIKDAAKLLYGDDDHLVAGITVSVGF